MIDVADEILQSWVSTVLEGVSVSLNAPKNEQTGSGVNLYLFGISAMPPLRTTKRPPLQVALNYLVSAWAQEIKEAHQILGKLLFAAMERGEFDVDFNPAAPAMWQAFDMQPRPSFILRVPLRHELPQDELPLVRGPIAVKHSVLQSLDGVVLSPDNVPLAGVQVELSPLDLSTRTDFRGHFNFAAIPRDPPVSQITVRAKGRQLLMPIDRAEKSDGLLLIRFQLTEE